MPRKFVVQEIPLDEIRTDGGTQARSNLIPAVVEKYKEDMKAGDEFPPLVVYRDKKGNNWLVGGFHRRQAKFELGHTHAVCKVFDGSQDDAILASLGENSEKEFGIVRSNADKRRVVTIALSHPKFMTQPVRWVAKHCRVSHGFVHTVRKLLEGSDGRSSSRSEPSSPSKSGSLHPVQVLDPPISIPPIPRRPDLDSFVQHIRSKGEAARKHVKTDVGVVDIVSDRAIYITSIYLTPSNFPELFGRLILARRCLRSPSRAVLVAFAMEKMPKYVEVAT